MVGGVLTLGITTSTSVMGVALADGARVVAHRVEPTDRRHAERLLPLVHEVLAEAGHRLPDVRRLAVDVGPGLFTGLRVGLATVGGLARGGEVRVVTASSLFLVAAGAQLEGELLAVIDARRSEVFVQRFRRTGDRVVALDEARVLDPLTDAAWLPALPAVGDGAVRHRESFEAAGATVRPGDPSPIELVRRADDLPTSPTRIPSPCYLRDPDARIGTWSTRAPGTRTPGTRAP